MTRKQIISEMEKHNCRCCSKRTPNGSPSCEVCYIAFAISAIRKDSEVCK